MLMPGRKFSSDKYRYGFNEQEKMADLDAEGNVYDFGARMYSPRLGKWLSTDPKMSKYPGHSPYIFSANSPNAFLDPDGEDWIVSTSTNKKTGVTTINITINAKIVNNSAQPIDMKILMKNVKANVERLYTGSDPSRKLEWKTTLNIEEFKVDNNNNSNLKRTDHFIEILDKTKFTSSTAGYAYFGGLYVAINADYLDASGTIGAIPKGQNSVIHNISLFPHEIGHTGGLQHPWEISGEEVSVNGNFMVIPGQIDADNRGVDLYFTFMGYATRPPAGVGQAGDVAYMNPNKATVEQILDIKLNYEKGNLNGNNTISESGRIVQKRTQSKKSKE